MDDFDVQILKQLQTDSRQSTEAVGSKIGLSASSCQRRIKKLKQQGVIQTEVAILDRSKLPNIITTIVEITLEKGGEQALNATLDDLNNEASIQQLYYMAGDIDFVVIVVTNNMEEFDQLSRKLFMSNTNIKKFTTKVVIKPHKTNLSIPLDKLTNNSH
ncbi:putative HTH-type transcriptional regulator y4tD [Thalassotalea insulae]|uniref:HTH-type transcriptional regulator y4tD n=1 Tax=Thalassotalea insulae TaxID=2056778 RepID=A0ABQ6GRL3_9GAMM|nr:Lrp/AsnC family transcriptional regulator [Thalassotalea insulae]GLX78588.1 putative HTH-type transcriptional regulator y4tD [Thalassotalea insulae]